MLTRLLDDCSVYQKELPIPQTSSSQQDMNEKLQQTFLQLCTGKGDPEHTSTALGLSSM
jgi:hypothetical protein